MANLEKEQTEKIEAFLKANGMNRVTIQLWLMDKGYSSMPTDAFDDMRDALYNEVGGEGWKSEWDL